MCPPDVKEVVVLKGSTQGEFPYLLPFSQNCIHAHYADDNYDNTHNHSKQPPTFHDSFYRFEWEAKTDLR